MTGKKAILEALINCKTMEDFIHLRNTIECLHCQIYEAIRQEYVNYFDSDVKMCVAGNDSDEPNKFWHVHTPFAKFCWFEGDEDIGVRF